MGGPLTASVLVLLGALPFDPLIDQAREPPGGLALSAGLERLDDALGFWFEVRSPRLLEDHFALSLAGGFGWFPGVASVSENEESSVGPWSPYGQVRLRGELALRMAESPHRLYVALGPSALFPSSELSTTRVGPGLHGGFGVEFFAGDRYRVWPFSLGFEVGAVVHLARADARVGEAENAAPIGTGLYLSVGVRSYPFEAPQKPAHAERSSSD